MTDWTPPIMHLKKRVPDVYRALLWNGSNLKTFQNLFNEIVRVKPDLGNLLVIVNDIGSFSFEVGNFVVWRDDFLEEMTAAKLAETFDGVVYEPTE